MIVPCVALFSCISLLSRPHPLIPAYRQAGFSKRRRTVLHIFNDLHNYHIIFITLLNIFGDSDCYQNFREARAVYCSFPSRGQVRSSSQRRSVATNTTFSHVAPLRRCGTSFFDDRHLRRFCKILPCTLRLRCIKLSIEHNHSIF